MDYKVLVQRGYDKCAGEYERTRCGGRIHELKLLTSLLSTGAQVLDIGCGSGIPITKALAKDYHVTGVDISQEQIQRAKENVPESTFIQGDIMAINFAGATFEAVVSFYTIFHLPREEHAELIQRIHQWLKPGGYLLATFSYEAEEAYIDDDFFGVMMYWSNLGLQDYQRMLRKMGFKLLATREIGHGYNEDSDALSEHHPLIFAQAEG